MTVRWDDDSNNYSIYWQSQANDRNARMEPLPTFLWASVIWGIHCHSMYGQIQPHITFPSFIIHCSQMIERVLFQVLFIDMIWLLAALLLFGFFFLSDAPESRCRAICLAASRLRLHKCLCGTGSLRLNRREFKSWMLLICSFWGNHHLHRAKVQCVILWRIYWQKYKIIYITTSLYLQRCMK